jgi:hypothetical protein
MPKNRKNTFIKDKAQHLSKNPPPRHQNKKENRIKKYQELSNKRRQFRT